jgi:hypothetical protein
MKKIEGFENVYRGKKNGISYIIGTVGELLKMEVLSYCDYNKEAYCFIPQTGKAYFAKTLEEITELKDKELSQ